MDRVFSVDGIANQFWPSSARPPQPGTSAASASKCSDESSKMNRSESEWAFQRFLQETNVSESSSSPPQSSSSNAGADYRNGVVVEANNTQQQNVNAKSGSNTTAPYDAAATAAAPPNIPVDSEEYQAFLKSKLNLACAAVAMSRVSYLFIYLFSYLSTWVLFGCRES